MHSSIIFGQQLIYVTAIYSVLDVVSQFDRYVSRHLNNLSCNSWLTFLEGLSGNNQCGNSRVYGKNFGRGFRKVMKIWKILDKMLNTSILNET